MPSMPNIVGPLAIVGLAMLLGGCDVPAIHGIMTADVAREAATLVGTWTEGRDATPEIVAIVREGPRDKPGSKSYVADISFKRGKENWESLVVDFHLVELDGVEYLDLFLSKNEQQTLGHKHMLLALPMHQILKVSRTDDSLKVFSLNADWIKDAVKGGRVTLAHTYQANEMSDKPQLLLTASTEELQKFLRANGNEKGLFHNDVTLNRVKPVR